MSLAIEIKAGAVAFATILYLWLKHRHNPKQLPLPPGPPRLPIIGNVHQLPKREEWIQYHEWCREYDTDIIYLNFMGMDVVVLDTPEATTELLDKNSSIFSSRPSMTMITDLMGWDGHMGLMPYGDRWRQHRRAMHQYFHSSAALQFCPAEAKATRGLLRRLLTYSSLNCFDNILGELRQMSGETIIRVTYGLPVLQKNDPYIAAAERGAGPFNEALKVNKFLVDLLPVLKYLPDWMPGAAFKRKAMEWRKTTQEMINVPFDGMKEKMQHGDVTFSFASQSLLNINPERDDVQEKENVIKNTAAAIYGAGSESTVAAIGSCVLGLLENPDVLKKAQKCIDELTDGDRLPTFDDFERLPYITAVVNEGLRWRDVAPIGKFHLDSDARILIDHNSLAIPHYTEVEAVYNGYRIPAGSIVIPNGWAMLHNPDVYPDPSRFNPDRFMKEGRLDLNAKDPGHAMWGFGRRICPGRHMAFTAVWTAIASLVATFDITKATGEDGNIIEPGHDYDISVLRIPRPFKCAIKPRSKEAEELILAAAFEENY